MIPPKPNCPTIHTYYTRKPLKRWKKKKSIYTKSSISTNQISKIDLPIYSLSNQTTITTSRPLQNKKATFKAWEKKKAEYEANDISEQNGNLFTTEDDEGGGLDSKQIEAVINQIKKM